jgi:hypothetical protein
LTSADIRIAREAIASVHWEGLFTPIGMKPTGNVPSVLGGFDWGGPSYDPERRILVRAGESLCDDCAALSPRAGKGNSSHAGRAVEGPLPIDLLRRAVDQLRAWRVVLPVHSTIERLVASVATGAQQEIFERVTSELPSELKEPLDELLQPPDGDNCSRLFRLKEYPAHASAPAIIIGRFISLWQER